MRTLVAPLVLSAALLTACSGGRDAGAPPPPTTGPAPSATTAASPDGTEPATTVPGPAPADLALKVTFDRGDRSRATLAFDGTGRAAYTDGTTTFLVLDDRTVTCTGTGRNQVCTERAEAASVAAPTAGDFARYPRLLALAQASPGTTTATDVIVRRAATCTTFDLAGLGALGGSLLGTGAPVTGTGRLCTDDATGMLLLFTSDATARTPTDIVAVQVAKPAGRDFDPPKPPTPAPTTPALPALPGGAPSP